MTQLYLGPIPWITDPVLGGYYSAPAGVAGFVDLRSYDQCAQPNNAGNGFGVFEADSLGSDYTPLGSLEDEISPKHRDLVASALGLKQQPVGGTVLEYLYEILAIHGDVSGDLHLPLMPSGRKFEVWLSNRLVIERQFDPQGPEAIKVQESLRAQYRAHRDTSVRGDAPADQYLKVLDYWTKQYKLPPDWFQPDDLPKEQPVKHETTITDNFNRADGSIGSSAEGWSWTATGTWTVASNGAGKTASGSTAQGARAESDLSSADHYAQAAIASGTIALGCGPAFRYSAAAQTYYTAYNYFGVLMSLSKVVAGTPTFDIATGSYSQSSGDIFKGEANGSTIKVYANGVEKISVTDTSITGNLRTGLFQYNTQSPSLDDFQAADLAVVDTYTGSLAKSLASATAVAAATFAPGTHTATLASSLGKATAIAAMTFAPGTHTATVNKTFSNSTAVAAATFVQPSFTASISKTISKSTAFSIASYWTLEVGTSYSDSIDGLLSPVPSGDVLSIFSTESFADNNSVYNTNLWGGGGILLDFTGCCWFNPDTISPIISPVAITKRHVLSCEHAVPGVVGDHLVFVSDDGTRVARQIAAITETIGGSGNSDSFAIAYLSSDLPASIANYPLLNDTPSVGLPGIVLHHTPHEAGIANIAAISASGNLSFTQPTGTRLLYYEDAISGDSGSPCFMLHGSQLIYATSLVFGGGGSGPCVTGRIAAILAACEELDTDDTGYLPDLFRSQHSAGARLGISLGTRL